MSRKPLIGEGEMRMTLLESFRKTFSNREGLMAEAGGRAVGEMASVPISEFITNIIKRARG
jgi:hypothetical protein